MGMAAIVQREPHRDVWFRCLESVEFSSMGPMFLHFFIFTV